MKTVRESSRGEYALAFWLREHSKDLNQDGRRDRENVGNAALDLLNQKHHYKLPQVAGNDLTRIVLLDREEVESLLIHKDMLDHPECGIWIRDRIQPAPKTRRLKDLAEIFLDHEYFEKETWKKDAQYQHYRDWKALRTLERVLVGAERPLIECLPSGEYEIVDGWGRLLPFMALMIKERLPFSPVEAFLACRQ